MDLDGLRRCSRGIEEGEIRTVAVDTPEPSPFSHEILNANPYAYLDDAPLEERRARAVQMRRTLRTDVADGAGAARSGGDRAGGGRSVAGGARCRRTARCAADAGDPAGRARNGQPFFAELVACAAGHARWTAASGSRPNGSTWCGAPVPMRDIAPAIAAPPLSRALPESREALRGGDPARLVRIAVPVDALPNWRDDLALPAGHVEIALAQLEAEGQILRGRVYSRRDGEIEWCAPAAAGAHTPADDRAAAARDRAGHHGAASRVRRALAARGARHATARRRWRVAGDPAIAGSGMGGGRVGDRGASPAHRELRSGAAGRALPVGRSDVGAALAASGVRARD